MSRPTTYYSLGPKESLFPNGSLDAWTNAGGKAVGKGWGFQDGTLVREGSAGDMISKKEYDYFVLEFDWAIAVSGNAGVKYRVKKFGNDWLGCEYQMLDDGGPKTGETAPKRLTGALYDVYVPSAKKHLKPAGEFNHSKIVVFGNRIEHWLNGTKILTVYSGTKDWRDHVAQSKFKDAKGFGENTNGRLLIQDHGSEVKIKEMTVQEYKKINTSGQVARPSASLFAPIRSLFR